MSSAVLLFLLGCATPTDTAPEATPTDTAVPCPAGTLADAGTCVPEACGLGPFGAAVGDLHVDPTAPEGGDGSDAAPFRTIAEALDAEGDTLVLAGGDHPGPVTLSGRQDRALVGRCADLTRIVTVDTPDPALTISRVTVGLSGLSLAPDGGFGALIEDGATVTATDLVVQGATGAGVAVFDATLDATRLTVTETAASDGGDDGYGVEVAYAEVSLVEPVLAGNRVAQVLSYGSGGVEVEGGSLADGVAGASGFGAGVRVERGGSAHLVGTSIPGAQRFAALVSGSASSLDLDGVDISEVHDDEGLAIGVWAVDGATATLVDTRVTASDGAGLLASEGADLTATRATLADATHPNSSGMVATSGATLTCVDCTVATQQVAGAYADDEALLVLDGGTVSDIDAAGATSLTAVDGATIRATGVSVRGGEGPGARADLGAHLVLTDCTFDATGSAGVVAYDGATIDLLGGTITGTSDGTDILYGFGVVAFASTVTVDGTTFDDTRAAAIAVSDAALSVDEVQILGTDTTPEGDGGYGIELVGASVATLTDVSLVDLTGVGVLAGEGTTVEATGLNIDGVYANPGMRSGPGVAAQLGGWMRLEGSTVRRASPGVAVLQEGTVEGSGLTIEACGFAGVVVGGGALSLEDSVIVDGTSDPSTGGGVGVFVAEDRGVGSVTLDRVTIGAHPVAAVWTAGATAVHVTDADLTGGPGYEREGLTLHGNALFAREAPEGSITVTDTRLGGSRVAVLLHDATAVFGGTTWDTNVVDLVVQGCDGLPVPDPDGAPTSEICTGTDEVYLPLTWNFVLPDVAVEVE